MKKDTVLMKKFAVLGMAIAMVLSFGTFIAKSEAYTYPAPPCNLEVKKGGTKVDFGGVYLLTNDGTVTKSANLLAGLYDIYLQSFDGYTGRASVYQPSEKYLVYFGQVARSNSTPDLGDYSETANWSGRVNHGLFLPKNVTQVTAQHTILGDTSTGPNSVRPICMVANPIQVCGDGVIEPNEKCDDGNVNDGDGCSSSCQIEPYCGDGKVNQPSEKCDDGNTKNGDGCSSTCKIEPFCGDGVINQPSEKCDDGNKKDGDGCSSTCQIEPPKPYCGDGKVNQPSEKCDDGNTKNGDGCSSTCQIEVLPFCGDGKINQLLEECDDGNRKDGDGCSAFCKIEITKPYCGDGKVNQPSEKCDDGNKKDGDGCSSTCQPEKPEEPKAYCGDGKINQDSEKCDDGNNKDGDGCSSTCQVEEDDDDDDDEESCKGSIGNDVWFDLNRNGIREDNETGIKGITVKLIHGNDVDKDNTNSKGRYEFDKLCSGTYRVVVDNNDIPEGCYQVSDPDGKLDNSTKVRLKKGQDYTKADFGYVCPGPVTPPTGPGLGTASAFVGVSGLSVYLAAKRKELLEKLRRFRKK